MLFVLSAFAAPPVMVPVDRVLAAATFDANGDGGVDRAVLVGVEDPALHVFLSQPTGAFQHIVAPHLAWTGAMWGTLPSLEPTEKGSLKVHSENSAIGRSRWSQTLTLSFREGKLVVSGYTWSSYDTLDPSAGRQCDLNLLTGRGTANGKAVTVPVAPVAAADWTEASVPAVCGKG